MPLPRADGVASICVVGSSHMMALHSAAEGGAVPPGVALDFRGLGGREFFAIRAEPGGLVVDRRRLLNPDVPKKWWGPLDEPLRYAGYDGFAVIGTLRSSVIVENLARARAGPYTAAYARAGLTAYAERDHGIRLAGALARHSGRPVAVTIAPQVAEPPEEALDWRAARAGMVEIVTAVAGRAGAVFVPQPEETLEGWASTRPEYAVGSVRLTGREHPLVERKHMNAAYGAIALPAVLHALTSRITAGARLAAARS